MRLAIAALSMAFATGAIIVHAQPGSRQRASIPTEFHGRWAENQRACRPRHLTTVITIDGRGWSSFEEGGWVVGVGQARRGTHYFRLNNYAGAGQSRGSLAMRRVGPRIVMSFQSGNQRPLHRYLIRCR